MPNRIIKESIRTSDTLASVSPEAERLFWRLVVSVDDFGRFDGRPNIILGQCLSAFYGEITVEQVEGWLHELQSAGVLQMYTHESRPYLMLTKWNKHQRTRAKDSKFPSPDDIGSHPLSFDSKRSQVKTDVVSNVFVFESVSENVSGSENVFDMDKSMSKDVLLLPKDVSNFDEYCREIELQLVSLGASRNYSSQGDEYRKIKQFYEAGIPLEFIKRVIVNIDSREKAKGKKGPRSFSYCQDAVEEEWTKELIKNESLAPLEFHNHVAVGKESYGPHTPSGLPSYVLEKMKQEEENDDHRPKPS